MGGRPWAVFVQGRGRSMIKGVCRGRSPALSERLLILNDSHCHFFSTKFFTALGKGLPGVDPRAAADVAIARLDWEAPGTSEQLAGRGVSELDRHNVARAVLIASTPDDEESVGVACVGHPTRFVGFFMLDPTQ